MVSDRASFARPLQRLFHVGTLTGLTDAELLERFVSRSHEEAELAFAALVERHGAMVHGVIRRVLPNRHDAQDAFQATFLVLLRRAHSIRNRHSLASWLHGVALRVAWSSRLMAARHRKHERRKAAAASGLIDDRDSQADDAEIGPIIHQELSRLPERYRAPLILCYLEGLTHEQTAARLIWPVGTVKSRLSRGRDRLRERLLRRGVEPWSGVISALSFRNATHAVLPAALVETTIQAASQLATAGANAGRVAAPAAALAEEVMKSMLWTKLRTAALALTIIAAGGIVLAQKTGAAGGGAEPPDPAAAGRILILDAPGAPDQGAPTLDEIWNKFVETRFPSRKVAIEKIADRADACKMYPLAGPCQLVHQHYKCTLYYDERRGNDVQHGVEVVYIDKDHLRRCIEPSHGHAKSADLARPVADENSQLGAPVAEPALDPATPVSLGAGTRQSIYDPAVRETPAATLGGAKNSGITSKTQPSTMPGPTASTTETPPGPMPGATQGGTTASDQERRLATVEQKLDRVLRLLEESKVEKRSAPRR